MRRSKTEYYAMRFADRSVAHLQSLPGQERQHSLRHLTGVGKMGSFLPLLGSEVYSAEAQNQCWVCCMLTGAPGSGKTAAALGISQELRRQFPHGGLRGVLLISQEH